MLTILYGILGLGLIVLIHETGHLIAARICGVKVEAFSVGMGPILLHKTIKDTDYRLSLIPLGGYCEMKGEKAFSEALDSNAKEITGEPDSLYGVHPLKRAFIAFNAANEIAVEAFINHKIGFYDISRITENVLNKDWSRLPVTYNEVLLFDSMAREFAKEQLC